MGNLTILLSDTPECFRPIAEQVVEKESKLVKDRIFQGHITSNIYVSPFDTVPSCFAYFHTGGTLRFIMKTKKEITI